MTELDLALLQCQENIEEFQANLSELRSETMAMRARLTAFDRKMGQIDKGIANLGDASRALAKTMDRSLAGAA